MFTEVLVRNGIFERFSSDEETKNALHYEAQLHGAHVKAQVKVREGFLEPNKYESVEPMMPTRSCRTLADAGRSWRR